MSRINPPILQSSSLLDHSIRGAKRRSGNKNENGLSHLFTPVPLKAQEGGDNAGEEMVGPIRKDEMLRVLNRFYSDQDIKELATENGIDKYVYQQTFINFRKFCVDSESLPVDLHIILADIIQGSGHIHDLYPIFIKHAKKIFPHLNCLEDLCNISDLTKPPNWYAEARGINRKIIFHAGPTNSGKTYHAMEQFLNAESGVYCGPLKLLAAEVFSKSNDKGTPCDLVTGEERRYGNEDDSMSKHVACTVEMTSVNTLYDVAVIDEIQMMRDIQRGWAWTRALLGICAREVHVCGEASAIELVHEIALHTGDEVEVRRYKRLTELTIEERGLESLSNIQAGDCIVCFSKRDIHQVSRELEQKGYEVAIIYGGLPPTTKLKQAAKFNDPQHPCKVMVATDAIGMGLNLSIRRIIFYSLIKPNINEKGEKEMETLSVSAALQIAGRAGRYGTQWENGYVTTMHTEDLGTLHHLLSQTPDDMVQAGLHPTADQIELFAYHLPSYTLSNLIDIFINLCQVDSNMYFMCNMDDFKFLADLIQHIPLQLRSRYVFCCAPINKKMPFVCAQFLKFTRQFSQGEPATLEFVCHQVRWPFSAPRNILELVHLEEVFDVMDLYLWLSYRFQDMFPDGNEIRSLQYELDEMIENGVANLAQLLRNADVRASNLAADTEEIFQMDAAKKSRRVKEEKVTGAHGRGRLTERLLAQGLLSPKMLDELQQEWQKQGNEASSSSSRSSSSRQIKSRRKFPKK